jgi:protein TonB
MYERNGIAVSQPTVPPDPARAFNSNAATSKPIFEVRRVTANLTAGMLDYNQMKRPRSAVDFLVSVTGHSLLLATAILLPLFFTSALDLHQAQITYLVAPPAAPPPAPAAVVRPISHPKPLFVNHKLYSPRYIPKHIEQIKDLSSASHTVPGVPGGVIGGVPGGQLGGVLGGILGGIGRPSPPPAPKPVAHLGPYHVGGLVQAPRLVHEVQPAYPPLAKAVRVQGDVVIESVIDASGNVTQMKLISGSPLLANAAFSAVGQWKYQPTPLNGTPVPVEMDVTVHFTLSS